MVMVKRQTQYKYVAYVDGIAIAAIFRGGDGKWRIFGSSPLPFLDATVTNEGYLFIESAINDLTSKVTCS
jgi:hypothetical protein